MNSEALLLWLALAPFTGATLLSGVDLASPADGDTDAPSRPGGREAEGE